MKHWAAKYIGADYEAVGRCWGAVRIFCRERFGEDMPGLKLGTIDENVAAIKRAVSCLGWRKVDEFTPKEDDVVVMEGPDGRHVAWGVEFDGRVGVIHACNAEHGVEAHTWQELTQVGFHSFEIWRCMR